MPKMPVVSGMEVVRALERMGFVQVRQCGSYIVLRKSIRQGDVGCVVPRYRELAPGILRGILGQANI